MTRDRFRETGRHRTPDCRPLVGLELPANSGDVSTFARHFCGTIFYGVRRGPYVTKSISFAPLPPVGCESRPHPPALPGKREVSVPTCRFPSPWGAGATLSGVTCRGCGCARAASPSHRCRSRSAGLRSASAAASHSSSASSSPGPPRLRTRDRVSALQLRVAVVCAGGELLRSELNYYFFTTASPLLTFLERDSPR